MLIWLIAVLNADQMKQNLPTSCGGKLRCEIYVTQQVFLFILVLFCSLPCKAIKF